MTTSLISLHNNNTAYSVEYVGITIYNSMHYNYLMPLSLSPKAQLKIIFEHSTVSVFT